jgi:hypothetical protein
MLKPPGDHDYETQLYSSLYRTMRQRGLGPVHLDERSEACINAVQKYLDHHTADLRLWFWEYEAACEEIIEQFVGGDPK